MKLLYKVNMNSRRNVIMQSGLILMPFFSWLLKRQFH